MKIKCDKYNLSNAINNVQKAISNRTTLPILEGILLKTENGKLILTGNNLDLCIKSSLDVQVDEDGSIVVPSRYFGEIVKRLPESDLSINVLDNNRIMIKSGKSEFEIAGLDPTDYPDMPSIASDNKLTIKSDKFDTLIKKTIFAVSQDEAKPIITGELLVIKENEITMVALDGIRVAIRKDSLESSYTENRIVIPGKNLSEISKILLDVDNDITINYDNKNILIYIDDTLITSRLLSGNFLDYEKVIPNYYKTRVTVNTKLFQESLERASIILKEGNNNIIKLNISNDIIKVYSNSQQGRTYEEVPSDVEGPELEIGFNSRYFIEILKAIDDEEIYLEFTSSIGACIIKPVKNNDFIYFILPVKLANSL